ncbi:MAG: MliC family protein [Pseudomonadota bacterium]
MLQHCPLVALSVVLAAALTACVSAPAISTAPKSETVSYRCAGDVDITVIYSGRATGLEGSAELVWEGHSFPLKQEVSGSGARYTDGTLTLSEKGDEVFVEKTGEMVLKDCNAKRITS